MQHAGLRRFTRNMVFVAGAQVFVGLHDSAAATVGASCDQPPKDRYAGIDYADYGQCVQRRATDEGGALILTDKSTFATRCPVTILSTKPHEDTKCKEVPNALQLGDALRVDEWANGEFTLSLMRPGKGLVFPVQTLKPIAIDLDLSANPDGTSDGTPDVRTVTIGYYADVEVPVEGHPNKKNQARYQIYLSNVLHRNGDEASLEPIRYYSVEVFEDAPDCRAEQPTKTLSKVVGCSSIEMQYTTNGGAGQLPSGGGGEPPPKPGS